VIRRKLGRGSTEILNSGWILWGACVGIGKNREHVRPVYPEDLPYVGVSVDLLSSMIFMEILSPAPRVNVRRARDRRYYSVEGVRTESMGIVQEHHELKNGLFVVGEIDEGSLGYLARYVCSVNTVVSAGMIDVRTEELGVSGPAVIHITEEVDPASVDDLLSDLAKVRRERLNPLFVGCGRFCVWLRCLLFKNVLPEVVTGDAFDVFEGKR
jgi:hypothetical protein